MRVLAFLIMPLHVTATTACDEAIYPPGATFGPRVLGDWEFVWMIEGDALYRCDEKEIEVPAGAILLSRPGSRDFFRWDTKIRTRHAYAHFRVLQLPSRWPAISRWPQLRVLPEGDALRPLFSRLLQRAASTRSDHFASQECRFILSQMLTVFVGGATSNENAASPQAREVFWPDAVKRAWHIIATRAAAGNHDDFSLPILARESLTTPEHLCRAFRAATGFSPMQAWRLARLDRALVLLARSNFSVGEIAHLCGFASAFHFSRCFGETFGKSPRALRHDLQNGAELPPPTLRSPPF